MFVVNARRSVPSAPKTANASATWTTALRRVGNARRVVAQGQANFLLAFGHPGSCTVGGPHLGEPGRRQTNHSITEGLGLSDWREITHKNVDPKPGSIGLDLAAN